MTIDQGLQEHNLDLLELPRHSSDERHFVIKESSDLLQICQWAQTHHYDLCTMIATDERLRLERAFKIFYIFLAPQEDEVVILEYILPNSSNPFYPSIAEIFPNARLLEREILDLFGLFTKNENPFEEVGGWLHPDVYPDGLFPLRRKRLIQRIRTTLRDFPRRTLTTRSSLPHGMFSLPVGPIHAGVIEAGHFPFEIAGEVIEKVPVRLGYKHRGIEKLFETDHTLEDGWRLAEEVSGDSSFAHSLAYCQAIENLAGVTPPEVALYWRALFLELERIYNHISDTALLATGLAYEKRAAELSLLREAVVQINEKLSGNRLLRRLNRPGGLVIPLQSISLENFVKLLSVILDEFFDVTKELIENPECRNRMMTTGYVPYEEARFATGIVRRASGWLNYDSRVKHPRGIYQDSSIQKHLRETIALTDERYPNRRITVYEHDLAGDVQARQLLRLSEVETSGQIIEYIVNKITENPNATTIIPITDQLKQQPNMEIGLGCVEGWRGDIVYFVLKGSENSIFRCKVRDPSLFNWHVFMKAVEIKTYKPLNINFENLLADFPLINKSFNLSYAGHDL